MSDIKEFKEFNRTVGFVVSIPDGHKFECRCGTVKLYKDKFFHDTHREAVAALNRHKCHV